MPNSLEDQDETGQWAAYGGGNLIVQRSYVELDGEVYLRARTAVNLSSFPLSYFSDMEQRLAMFKELIGDPHHPMLEFDAYNVLFDTIPTEEDLASLHVCLSVLEASPKKLCERFGRGTPLGRPTWIDFVAACQEEGDMPRGLYDSPLLRRQKRHPTRASEDDVNISSLAQAPHTPRRPAWQGPPQSEASSSRVSAAGRRAYCYPDSD
ncbi:hypothetical protein AURDEDRAFT_124691 [Auricularia subglabra TFB-10046 SS5]|nr:hypothetical protein AURDEDRAFT_124691 [Auricularia subglabra TFB-10046 SS5]